MRNVKSNRAKTCLPVTLPSKVVRPAPPTGLAEIAAGRDLITTRELAHLLCKAEQTLRKLHCVYGEAYGIRAIKIGNALLWPVSQIGELLRGEA